MKPVDFFICLGVCLVISGLIIWAIIESIKAHEIEKAIEDGNAKGPIGFGPSPSAT
jgi:hypothetical protein